MVNDNFHIRSEGARQIIEGPPSFFDRWAMIFLLSIFALAMVASYIVSYPTLIRRQADIVSQARGSITILFQFKAKERQTVHIGDSVILFVSGVSERTQSIHGQISVMNATEKQDLFKLLIDIGGEKFPNPIPGTVCCNRVEATIKTKNIRFVEKLVGFKTIQ